MSKLQELIDHLCPNGVEFGKLGDYIDIYTGSQFNKRDMNDAGSYPVINGGVNASGYIESFNEEAKTITIWHKTKLRCINFRESVKFAV